MRKLCVAALAALCFLLVAAAPAMAKSIDALWEDVRAPRAPGLSWAKADPASTALLVLDIEELTCNARVRPRCLETVPRIAALLARARSAGVSVIYSTTLKRTPILPDVLPRDDEPVVASSVDKFWRTDLEEILHTRGVTTVVVTGTAAHGAVLHTATSAGFRGFRVLLPVDCLSAWDIYAEQAAVQLLLTGPATRKVITLTRSDLITFPE
jgi:nicotinamidase-related amidase